MGTLGCGLAILAAGVSSFLFNGCGYFDSEYLPLALSGVGDF